MMGKKHTHPAVDSRAGNPHPAGYGAALDGQDAWSSSLCVAAGSGDDAIADESAAYRDVEHLVGIISHCGRNLLGPVKGYASLIQDDVDDGSNAHRWADKIERTAQILEDYLTRLGLYRVQGACGLRETTWATTVHDALNLCRTVRGAGAHVEVCNQASAGFMQHFELLKRVLFHVLVNACEAAGSNGLVRVTIAERAVNASAGRVREFTVSVEDNGNGLESGQIPTIFTPHYTTKHGHAGLGLSMIAAAAPALGMNIEIHSKPGVGTRVVLTLREARRKP